MEAKSWPKMGRSKPPVKRSYIVFGHYEKPVVETMFDTIGSKNLNKQLSISEEKSVWYIKDDSEETPKQENIIKPEKVKGKADNFSVIKGDDIDATKWKSGLLKTSTIVFKKWFDNEENKVLKFLMVILIGVVVTMFWYLRTMLRELRPQSLNSSKTAKPRSTDSGSSYGVNLLDNGEL